MFSRFSPAARAVITLAEQECRNSNHYYLGTEHLLLAMAIAPPPDIAEYFGTKGVEPWLVKRALRAAMAPPGEHPWEGIIVTPRVQRIFGLALSTKAPTEVVQPIDLLSAITRDGGGVAARVIEHLTTEPATRQQ
jgi:ATP-dependent Clp protease ATP-binding subunit ClpA